MTRTLAARRSIVTWTIVALASATVIGLVSAAHHVDMMAADGHPMPWRHGAVMEMPFWYAAVVLIPPLAWALARWPERSAGALGVAQLVAIGALWIVAQTLLEMGARSVLGTGFAGPPPTYLAMVRESLVDGIIGKSLLYAAIVSIIYGIVYHERFRERDLAASQLETRLAEMQLRLLRTQLNPHFLFNAMNTIAMLTRAGRTSESVAMLLELSTLMRDALRPDAAAETALEDELRLLRRYVGVEQVRFGGKLEFDVDVPETLSGAVVPGFLLQPLVENAIRHGRAPADGAAHLGVRAEQTGDRLLLTVWDDGPSFPAAAPSSTGIGLENVRERLKQIYGAAHSFEIGRDAARTVARISIPLSLAPSAHLA